MQQPVHYDPSLELPIGNHDVTLDLHPEALEGAEGIATAAAEAAAPKKEAETWDTRIIGHIVYVGDAVYKIVKSENGYLLMQFQDLTGSAKRRIAGYNNRNVRKGQGRRQFKRS